MKNDENVRKRVQIGGSGLKKGVFVRRWWHFRGGQHPGPIFI